MSKKEWHDFNPNDYEKVEYEVMLQDGTVIPGYPNAQKIHNLIDGSNISLYDVKKVRIPYIEDEDYEV